MHVKRLLTLSAFLFVCSLRVWPSDFSAPPVLRVSLLEGEVTYQRSDMDRWVDLSINTPILEGDKIWVGNEGRTEIEFENENFARLSANTIVEVVRLDGRGAQIRVNQGLVSFDLKAVPGSFSVLAPLFSAQVKEAANFRLDVDSEGPGRLVMFEGQAEISGQSVKLSLRKGETVRFLSQDDRYYLETHYAKDDWDRWNEERSAYLAKVLHDRLHDRDRGWTTADLYHYGSWYDAPGYGRIWRPRVAFDWVPFRNGRWVWYSHMGWTWVSYEPWGWVPYHYGRWTHVSRHGWSWVPGSRYVPWCPGAVNWVQGPHWVGWVPLAPYEPWYPHSSVNVFISKNFGHRSGVTYWHRDHFLNGRPVRDFRYPQNPYADGRIIAGQPRVTPTPASRMPVVGGLTARTFTNADLEARRTMRERIATAGAPTPVPAGASDFNRLHEQRSRVSSSRVSGFNADRQNLSPNNPAASTSATSGGPQTYDNWGANRSAVRSEQRRPYRVNDSGTDSVLSRSRSPARSTWGRPMNPGNGSSNVNPSAPPQVQDRYDSRQRIHEIQRNRNGADVPDRYAPGSIRRESPATRFGSYPPSSRPLTNPQGPPASHTAPQMRAGSPPSSHTGPTSPRNSVSHSQGGGSGGGASNHGGRSAVRGRMGR